jgi:multidrug efflux pump subunit AcrA (membrane-fusion protein)
LTQVHKFGECNQSKKFYRADHFRQHLKHSHGGQSGKWTNMLEAACMKEEPPVTPEAQSQEQLRLQQQQAQVAQAAQAAQAAAQQAQQAVQQSAQSPPPALTQYQAAQLQNATGAPVANMMGQSVHSSGYPEISSNSDVQFGSISEEVTHQE